MALPNGYTCVCPSSFTCSYLNTAPSCYFSFTFIVSAPDTSVRYLATDFITLDSSGSLPNAQSGQWAQSYSAIDVFAHNLGPVINQADGMLVSVDTLTHADTFVVPLSDEIPAVGGVQSMTQQHSFTGKLLGTNLLLSYSIACTGSLIGPNCDLSCTTSSINSATAACRSNDTGFYYVCTYSSGGQVSSCNSCPWGIKENTYCQDEGGGVLDPYTAGVVSSGFRTATIILSVLLLVFLLLIILLFVALCIIRSRRRPVEKEMVSYEHNGTPSSRPLLTAAYRAEQPTPQPRSSQPPSLDARPASKCPE
ncbi:unnamed protein product [Nippostrongylus brasiliensis]|uniref:EGF-like domain-containing protein n=1 Tax=Nippostrongylus brasiliensis TaxID=27835 RepID=A0A0N4Y9Z2_NIPBR|nr:unnamed protein product [Nippostrongylus brasiliensis]